MNAHVFCAKQRSGNRAIPRDKFKEAIDLEADLETFRTILHCKLFIKCSNFLRDTERIVIWCNQATQFFFATNSHYLPTLGLWVIKVQKYFLMFYWIKFHSYNSGSIFELCYISSKSKNLRAKGWAEPAHFSQIPFWLCHNFYLPIWEIIFGKWKVCMWHKWHPQEMVFLGHGKRGFLPVILLLLVLPYSISYPQVSDLKKCIYVFHVFIKKCIYVRHVFIITNDVLPVCMCKRL